MVHLVGDPGMQHALLRIQVEAVAVDIGVGLGDESEAVRSA